jgi:hypothetical protein
VASQLLHDSLRPCSLLHGTKLGVMSVVWRIAWKTFPGRLLEEWTQPWGASPGQQDRKEWHFVFTMPSAFFGMSWSILGVLTDEPNLAVWNL